MKHHFLFIITLFMSLEICVEAKTIRFENEDELKQNMLRQKKTKYIISGDMDLCGQTIVLAPKSKLIISEGSSLNNGAIALSSNCSVRGSGHSKESKGLKILLSGSDVSISDFCWSNTAEAILSYYDCSRLKIINCKITSTKNNCIKLVADNLSNVVVEDIDISNSFFVFKRMGIEIQNHGNEEYRYSGISIDSCQFDLLDQKPDYGFAVSLSGYGKQARITNSHINNAVYGVELVGFSEVSVSGNTFSSISHSVLSCSRWEMNGIHFTNNKVLDSPKARVYMSSVRNSSVVGNDLDVSVVELLNSNTITVSDNKIVSHGYYSIVMDNSFDNVVESNDVTQKNQNNYSVFRCIGQKSHGNIIRNNKSSKVSNSGVYFDQIKEAKDNKYEK